MDEPTEKALLWHRVWSRFQPSTPMGQQAKGLLSPFMPGEERQWQASLSEQERIMECRKKRPDWASRVEAHLCRLPDIRPILKRMRRGGTPGVADWFRVKQFLWEGRACRRRLAEAGLERALPGDEGRWEAVLRQLNPESRLHPSFSLSDAYDPELADLRNRWSEWDRRFREAGEQQADNVERDYGIRRNLEGEWVVDRRFADLPRLQADPRLRMVRGTPFEWIFQPVQTEEEKEAGACRESLQRRLEEKEAEVLHRLADRLRAETDFLEQAVREVKRFDLQWARVRAAETWEGTCPTLSQGEYRLEGGVHPAVQESLREEGDGLTPVDIRIRPGATVIIGPNMGGKTLALQTLGVVVALGQYGFLVPARSLAMPLVPWMAGVIGEGQQAEAGLSTFGAEVDRLARLLNRPSSGLLLLDEIGRGTNPVEGAALSAALTCYLAENRHWAVHVTHYQEVMQVEGIRAYRVAGLKQDDLPEPGEGEWKRELRSRMDYRLLPWSEGDEVPREALGIASLLGLPEEIIESARQSMERAGRDETGNPDY
ncbi:MutS-related protein [Paludifilum halophilum]|nr:hypothetical protein [Paludifilum halophilum]